jgi:hypothetical protein
MHATAIMPRYLTVCAAAQIADLSFACFKRSVVEPGLVKTEAPYGRREYVTVSSLERLLKRPITLRDLQRADAALQKGRDHQNDYRRRRHRAA